MPELLFVGDVMSHGEQNTACRRDGVYEYDRVFDGTRSLLNAADFRVGNLETPIAGEAMGYTDERYAFNSPRAFAQAVKGAPFDLVSTANNHCMDRGLEGLFNTVASLEAIGLDSVGTYVSESSRARPYLRQIDGVTVGFLSYTYGTNAFHHHRYIDEDKRYAVNLLQPEERKPGAVDLLSNEQIALRVHELYSERNEVSDRVIEPLWTQLNEDVARMRAAGAELIVFLMHSGGQYNPWPDAFTLRTAEQIRRAGVEAIVGHHPHVIHPLRVVEGCPIAYSLGNFVFTPREGLPGADIRSAYSIALSLHVGRVDGSAAIERMSFVPCKSVMRPDGVASVCTVYDLAQEPGADLRVLEADNQFCVNRFRGIHLDTPVAVLPEYPFDQD